MHESGGKFLTKRPNSENWEEISSSVRRAKEKIDHALRAALQRSDDATDQDDDDSMPSCSLPPAIPLGLSKWLFGDLA